jgi:hypothetical protein
MEKTIKIAGKIFIEGEKIQYLPNGNVVTIERILDAHKDMGIYIDIVTASGRRMSMHCSELNDFTSAK